MLNRLGTLLGAAAFLAASPSFAQRITGSLVGTVRDETGAVLLGVTVSLTGEKIVGTQRTVTNEDGFYRLIALPPGSYEMRFELAGFATLRRQGVRVAVGATDELGAVLKVSPMAEEVTVVGDLPIVDTQTNQVSTNYDENWVRNAPLVRASMFDLIAAAPGVSQGSMVFGSGSDENSYQMDGTELTSSFVGTAWPYPNTDAIEEVEVLTLGAPAEYGNVAGGVFNVVTRQGSNQFHGDLNFYLQTDGLTANNTAGVTNPDGSFADACPTEDDPNRRCSFHREKFHDATAQLSGPIVKDKLWFFLSYQYQRSYATPPAVDPRFFSRFEADRIFGKLNWQVSPRHKLAVSLHNDYYSVAGSPPPNWSPSNVTVDSGDNPTPSLMYTGILTNKTVVEARLAGFFGDDHTGPLLEGQARVQPVFYDLDTGQRSGGIFGWGDQKQFQQGATVKVSHFADDFLGGSHDFRFGVQQVRGGVDDAVWGYNDFILTYSQADASGSIPLPYGYQNQPYSYGGTTTGVGAFLDDTFRVSNRLTLNLGLRYDHNSASIPDLLVRDQQGNPTGDVVPARHLYSTDTFSPRIGFNFKLTPDGRTVLRGHYGRYYRGVVVGEFAANIGVSPYETRAGVYDLETGTFVDPTVTESSQNLAVSPHYTIPHTDQLVVSLERELAHDLGLSLHYVYKRGRGFSAWQDIRGRYEDAVYVDDRGVDASGRSIVVRRLLTDPADRFFEQQNPPQMGTSVHALSAQATKRLSRGWQLVASYTYLRSKGLLASGHSGPRVGQATSLLFSDFGQNPNDFVNAGGLLLADRPHTFKVQLVAELPLGFLVGANYLLQSGRTWARLMRVPGLGFPSAPAIQMEERDGSRRLPRNNILDLRLQKSFKLPKNAAFVLFGDVLNVFNDDSHLDVRSRIGDSPNYNLAAAFVAPRRAMLGAKLTF